MTKLESGPLRTISYSEDNMIEEHRIKKGLSASLARQMRLTTDEEREEMIRFMETDLHDFIVEHLMPEFKGIYLEPKSEIYSDLLKQLATNPVAKALDDASGQRYQRAMKLFRSFLQSKHFPKANLKVEKPAAHSSESVKTLPNTRYVEGAVTQQTIDKRERNSQARDAAIKRDKCRCRVCEFDFEKTYGPVGKEYIEVHHIDPISNHEDEHEIEVDKLVCLCANCHAMAHRRKPVPFSIAELKQMLKDVRETSENIH